MDQRRQGAMEYVPKAPGSQREIGTGHPEKGQGEAMRFPGRDQEGRQVVAGGYSSVRRAHAGSDEA